MSGIGVPFQVGSGGSVGANINVSQVGGTTTSVNNGSTDAGTLRVTISSDSSGQIKLAAGGNIIGSLAANQSVNLAQVGAASFALGQQLAAASIPVVLTAAQLTSLTPVTDTQYVDAAAAAAHPTGTGIIFNNGGTYNFVSALQPLPVTGSLTVGGTADNSAFTAGTSTGTPSMGFFHSTIDAVTDGRAAALAIDAKRNLFVVVRDAAGNARGLNIDSSGQLAVAQATAASLNATVVGTGTFAVQATLQTQTDTTMVGGVNIKEINAVTPLMGSGIMGTGSLRVTIASDNDPLIVKQATAANLNATVVGTGTFAVQATPVTQADTFMLGGVNVKEINGVAPLMGNGITGTGSLRVTIASDNTAFAVNATLSAETTKVIGTVNQGTSPWVVSNGGTFAVQATLQTQTDTIMIGGVNIKEINAITPLMGNGNTGTGSLRVTIAADNTAFAVNATLSAETTKVIGVVRTSDGAGNLLTSNSTTTTLKFGLDTNILSILGTAPTTAGKLDVKGADGDVFVRQSTGTNLHMVVDSGTITTVTTVTAVTAITNALPAGSALIGKVGIDQTTVGTTNAVSLAQIGTTTVATGNGTVSAGVQRVAIASDNTAFAVTATLQTQADTTMVGGINVKEINGVTPLMGVGVTGTGALRTVVANDSGKTLVSAGGSASSSGNNTLIAAGTNRLKVYAFILSTVSTTAVTCIFQSGASGTELWRVVLQTPASVAGGANLVVQPPAWLFATAGATLLNLNLSAAVAVNWSVSYWDEA